MHKIRNKILLSILAIILGISPLSYLFRTTVYASNSWDKITDEEFAGINYAVVSMVQIGEDVYFYTNSNEPALNVYKYDGQAVTLISSDLYEDVDNGYISGLVALGDKLLVLIQDGLGNKIMMYENGEWHTTYDLFTLPAGLIRGIASYQGNLIVWLWESADIMSGFLFGLVFTPGGDNLDSIAVGGATSFGDAGFDNMEVTQTYSSDDHLYMIGRVIGDGDVSYYFVFEYVSGTTWSVMGGAPFTDFIDDMVYFDGDFYIITSNWSDQLQVLTYDGEDWQPSPIGEDVPTGNVAGKFVIYDNEFLAMSTVRYDGGELLAFWGGSWTEMTTYIGDSLPDAGDESWSSTVIPYYGGLLIGISSMGEGPYNAEVWEFNVMNPYDDYDMDGVINKVEDMGPNAGDANDDSFPDKGQPNITNMFDPYSDNYVVLENDCAFNSAMTLGTEASYAEDPGFTYPAGLMSFHLILDECVDGTVNITQYFYGNYDASLIVPRKFNTNTHTFQTIPGATVENVTIGGQPAIKVTYAIVDGGPLDEDGELNGEIVDPSGIALNAVLVPNTGLGGSFEAF